ncbi:hypothetical protein EGW08_014806 [Elysia chlorotica]|uniref:Uncharacterized protein n=1 Tax=Elysia chlorotica TaxID=188477 RepID=A0A433T7C0_ELYCH|nr:hypothetical protein EGW08_014806 [Elysia chlorotica]
MLAIPPVEECDLHVAAFDDPSEELPGRKSASQYTFSSGSSNNPPHWELRQFQGAPQKQPNRTSSETTASKFYWEHNLGRRVLKSFSYPFASMFNRNSESTLISQAKKALKPGSTY